MVGVMGRKQAQLEYVSVDIFGKLVFTQSSSGNILCLDIS
jgi:hypothetical protein